MRLTWSLRNKTCNITLRRVRETIVAVEKRACVRACVGVQARVHTACNAHDQYCVAICGLSGSTTFFDIIS